MLPAVLWQVWIAYILLHCIFLIEPVLQYILSFLQIQTWSVIIRIVESEGHSQSGSAHPPMVKQMTVGDRR